MPIIDSDCHVIESEITWRYMDPSDEPYRALAPARTRDEAADAQSKAVLSGRVATPWESRTLADVGARLRHMDELGVDIQVLYPTVYLRQLATEPKAEAALSRSYNRWLADVWRQGQGRLRRVAVPPLLDLSETREQLRAAKEHGACGIFMRGFEGERVLSDPYFFPLYKMAEELDLPICIHAGCANDAYRKLVRDAFPVNRIPVVVALHALLLNGIPSQFPRLRVGFIEATAQWLPFIIHVLNRKLERDGKPTLGPSPLRDHRLWVTCQTDDDLAYIVDYVGEDNLLIGTDYGHADPSAELDALKNLEHKGDIPPAVARKFMEDNPRAFYGL